MRAHCVAARPPWLPIRAGAACCAGRGRRGCALPPDDALGPPAAESPKPLRLQAPACMHPSMRTFGKRASSNTRLRPRCACAVLGARTPPGTGSGSHIALPARAAGARLLGASAAAEKGLIQPLVQSGRRPSRTLQSQPQRAAQLQPRRRREQHRPGQTGRPGRGA